MAALYFCNGDDDGDMLRAMQQATPDLDIRVWPDAGNKLDIDCAIVWMPPEDFFDGLDNLTHVYSVSAGVDHLLLHPGLSPEIPLIRLFDAGMGDRMANYVLYGALHAQRRMPELMLAQQAKMWQRCAIPDPSSVSVGILGAGALGQKVARHLSQNGFPIKQWSRSPKQTIGTHFIGDDQLSAFLAASQILVCLLPLTDSTTGILNKALFSGLPDGAYVINPGRGQHLVVDDLLEALDSGKLNGAMIDVFETEPLPKDSPLWHHQRLVLTPHIAATSTTNESAEQIAQSMRDVAKGVEPRGLVDRLRGY
ncbi:MAG: glyoxylate/hydroxypyruvate reductase A [Granulosicoccaceae bacterium]